MSSSSSLSQYDKTQSMGGWPSSTAQGGAGAAVFAQNRIQYALPDSNQQLRIMTSTPNYQHDSSYSGFGSWTATKVADSFPSVSSSQFKVENLLAAVTVGGYNYFFWSNTSSGQQKYYVLRLRPDLSGTPDWSRLDISNDSGHTYQGNVACLALPSEGGELEGRIGAVLLYSSDSTYYFQTLLLDPADFASNAKWKPKNLNNVTSKPLSNLTASYTNLSAAWTSQGAGLPTDSAPALVSDLSLVVSVGTLKGQNVTYCGDLLQAFSAAYNRKLAEVPIREQLEAQNESHADAQHDAELMTEGPAETNVQLAPLTARPSFDNNSSITLCAAPDGQLLAQYIHGGKVGFSVLQPASGGHSAGWQSYPVTAGMPSCKTSNTPATVFVPLASSVGKAPVAVPDPNKNLKTYDNCTLQPFVQVTLVSDSNHQPGVGSFGWGTFFTIPSYESFPRTESVKYAASLVADTFPFPAPPKNWGGGSQCCEYEYLWSTSQETSIDYNLRSSVGIRFETTNLVAGVGVKAEGGLAAGFSLALSSSSGTHTASIMAVDTQTTSGAKGLTYQPINPNGTVFSTSPPATVYSDVAMVLRRGEKQASGTLAVALRPMPGSSARPYTGSFTSFLYAPGNLATYDPDRIDQTMADLYAQLSAKDKQRFYINGEDFGWLYTNPQGYTKSIIKRFGTKNLGPNGNQSYLSFSFASTGSQRTNYQATSAFRAGGSLFVEGSYYGGLAWNVAPEGSIGFLGIVNMQVPLAELSGYAMIGAEFSSELGGSNTTTTEWGVNLNVYNNALGPNEEYTVRMYILEPSPLWACELKCFGQLQGAQTIDTKNSAPVRILFTVPRGSVSSALSTRLQTEFAG